MEPGVEEDPTNEFGLSDEPFVRPKSLNPWRCDLLSMVLYTLLGRGLWRYVRSRQPLWCLNRAWRCWCCLPFAGKPITQEEAQGKGGTGNDRQPNGPDLLLQPNKEIVHLLRPSSHAPQERIIGASNPRNHSDVGVNYFSQHIHKLLLNRAHFRTRLVKRSGGIRQTGLLETLSQTLAQQLRNSRRVQPCFQFLPAALDTRLHQSCGMPHIEG